MRKALLFFFLFLICLPTVFPPAFDSTNVFFAFGDDAVSDQVPDPAVENLEHDEFQQLLGELSSRLKKGEISLKYLCGVIISFVEKAQTVPPYLADYSIEQEGFEQTFGQVLQERVAVYLVDHSTAEALGLKRLGEIFLDQQSDEKKAVDHLFVLVEKFEHYAALEDLGGLVTLRETVSNPGEVEIFETRMADVVSTFAKKTLAANQPELALRALAQLPSKWRGEKSMPLISRALVDFHQSIGSKSWDGENLMVEEPSIAAFLETIAEEHSGARITLIKIYGDFARLAMRQGDVARVEQFLSQVIKHRPDPHWENDDLRLELALEARTKEAQALARSLVRELTREQKLTWFGKLQLMLSGHYGTTLLFFLCASIGIAAVSLSVAIILPFFSRERSWAEPMVEDPNRYGSVLDEYVALLQVFGLGEDASEEDIKQAYRRMAKDLHPDTASGTIELDEKARNEKFIELKETHDRILEIKKSRFS